jgi:phosphoribosylformylglycinamidine cyclo-ligase
VLLDAMIESTFSVQDRLRMDYREAGVDISAADDAKARIGPLARATFNAGVLSEIGSFGGMFRPDLARYEEPVLVASTDGVGTKVKVAIAAGVHDTIGYDLVAHCVNDILVQGATPLFFLDYVALGRMDPARVEAIVRGVARGCSEFGCPLVGGETAEMPGTYAPDDYDLAGFIVGVVDRRRALTGEAVRDGDVLLALPSAGLHTNGYSLARKVLFERLGHTVETELPELGTTVGRALLAPHRGYLAALEPLLERGKVRALAHITGGGLPGNVPRVLPAGLGARIRKGSWEVPAIFGVIQRGGAVPDAEMYRTFNMGVGMVVVVAPEDLHDVEHSLERRGETSFVIGSVTPGAGVLIE